VYAANGTYTVTLSVTNGNCSDVIMQTITIGPTATPVQLPLGQPSVFPNPAREELAVAFLSDGGETTWRMRNLMGQERIVKVHAAPAGWTQIRLDVRQLPPGVYFLQSSFGMAAKVVKE
jgi:hypothetical protein